MMPSHLKKNGGCDTLVRYCLEEFKSTIVDIAAPEMRLQFDSPIQSPVKSSPNGISVLDKNNYFPTASKINAPQKNQ